MPGSTYPVSEELQTVNCTLTRKDYRSDGIWGEIIGADGSFYFNLEHSYPDGTGKFFPKIKAGVHKCVLYSKLFPGQVSRHGYDVYVLASPDDQGHYYEIHIGNYNCNTEGCMCIGLGRGRMSDGGRMLTSSKQAFDRFMASQGGADFDLTVIDTTDTLAA
jgi:hypothetical protein